MSWRGHIAVALVVVVVVVVFAFGFWLGGAVTTDVLIGAR